MILHIIPLNPEFNFEILKPLENHTEPEVMHIKSETGVLSLQHTKGLSLIEKKILIKYIFQVAPYLDLFVIAQNEKRKLDIP